MLYAGPRQRTTVGEGLEIRLTAIFVHLSDIHFGQEGKSGQRVLNEDARRQLIEDAAVEVARLPNAKASGIIVTGDIAYAGKRHEYEAAAAWMDQLAARVGCGAGDIQMIPGNHDVDRDAIKGMAKMMLNAIHDEGEARLDIFLETPVDRDVLYSRFVEYRRLADAYRCPLDCTGNSSSDRRVPLADGRAVRFVRLNSALICTKGREEEGKLLLGARQRVLEEHAGEELVVLTHHPLNWYADSADAQKFLRARARAFISGHEHLASIDVVAVEPGNDLLMIAAGATTPDKIDDTYTYAYNLIGFDWDEGSDALAVTLHPRAWNDEMKRFEADDGRLKGRDRRIVLGSPNFRKSPLPDVAPTEDWIHDQPAPVEIIISEEDDVNADASVDEAEYQNLHMRFFRDLGEGERLRILVELDVVPAEIAGGFKHETEARLLRSAVRARKYDKLRALVEEALARRGGVEGPT